MADFYKWGYDYGHNLDPTAAIQVPGLTYQPPLIGHKKLLNFDAYSYPDTGAWVVIAVTLIFFIIWFTEWRKQKKLMKIAHQNKNISGAIGLLSLLVLIGCNPKQEKINIGKDSCAECKMTIMDPKFGGEIITKKGKVYKFDDTHCVAAFLERRGVELSSIHQTLFVQFEQPNDFVNVKQAEFIVSSKYKSPMGGNAAAYKNAAEAKKKSEEIEGSRVTNWATLYNILIK
jgi:copper chaperone NosL